MIAPGREEQLIAFALVRVRNERRDREAARQFLPRALNHPDNPPPHVFYVDGNRSYAAALRQLQADGEIRQAIQCRMRRCAHNHIESDHRHIKRRFRAMQGARTRGGSRDIEMVISGAPP